MYAGLFTNVWLNSDRMLFELFFVFDRQQRKAVSAFNEFLYSRFVV